MKPILLGILSRRIRAGDDCAVCHSLMNLVFAVVRNHVGGEPRCQARLHQAKARLRSFFIILLLLHAANLTPAFPNSPASSEQKPYLDIARHILTNGLLSGKAYEMLAELTAIGPRLAASPQMAQAIQWSKKKMEEVGLENVRLQPVIFPRWIRGPVEEAFLVNLPTSAPIPLSVCALGGSIATPPGGITAEVIEVQSFEELQKRSDEARGKVVFFNRPMDRSKFNPGEAYGGAVNQRSRGAVEAAKVGGVAALVRSMTMALDDVPHTGGLNYVDTIPKIPAAAISTMGADFLSGILKKHKGAKVQLKLTSETLPDAESANVIGELVGRERPNEIVLVGAHLDSWDKGTGAHDNATGVAHVIEAVRLLKEAGLRPRRTIRVVLFENEENGLTGARVYAAEEHPAEKHIAGIESDIGGFSPRGFGVGADSTAFESIARWAYLFEPMDASRITRGGGGADLTPMMRKGMPGIGLSVEQQRYFDYHHSDHDTIDKVHPRELQLGAIAVAILAYVLAEEGITH